MTSALPADAFSKPMPTFLPFYLLVFLLALHAMAQTQGAASLQYVHPSSDNMNQKVNPRNRKLLNQTLSFLHCLPTNKNSSVNACNTTQSTSQTGWSSLPSALRNHQGSRNGSVTTPRTPVKKLPSFHIDYKPEGWFLEQDYEMLESGSYFDLCFGPSDHKRKCSKSESPEKAQKKHKCGPGSDGGSCHWLVGDSMS
jgi:hypothetical protein